MAAQVRLITIVLALWACVAHAQPWPSKPMRLIVPFPPGGPTDLIGRTAAKILSDALGQPVVVDNRPGGGGTVGLGALAKSAPDGYTIGMTAITLATAPHLGPVPFEPFMDFSLITNLVETTPLIAAHPSFPANTLAELVAYARANPAKVAYGTPGVATVPHLAAEMLQNAAGIKLVHVPYKGTAQLSQDLLAGALTLSFESSLTLAYPNMKGGKLKPIVMLSRHRSALLPNVPTAAESGFPSISASPWFGFGGPAGLSLEQVSRMHDILVKGVRSKEVVERMASIGAEITPSASPAEFAAFVRTEHAKWGEVIRRAGVKVE
ncbi:MAG TPA: tripartite tricarboxylate transporter substrate-binding protein [Burkholderiales bacterium]|nr:tripartite tricarboxylate transporter substrate-binding protein [Burkholderiales bacterium]